MHASVTHVLAKICQSQIEPWGFTSSISSKLFILTWQSAQAQASVHEDNTSNDRCGDAPWDSRRFLGGSHTDCHSTTTPPAGSLCMCLEVVRSHFDCRCAAARQPASQVQCPTLGFTTTFGWQSYWLHAVKLGSRWSGSHME